MKADSRLIVGWEYTVLGVTFAAALRTSGDVDEPKAPIMRWRMKAALKLFMFRQSARREGDENDRPIEALLKQIARQRELFSRVDIFCMMNEPCIQISVSPAFGRNNSLCRLDARLYGLISNYFELLPYAGNGNAPKSLISSS